ncbi:MAG: histidine triad nucleotide-binding protein [Anaerolineales bacterium]|nr:histidine triad nucleotide-binding protein [Anaerolineales bacterium]
MTAEDCLFCKIIAGDLPSDQLFKYGDITAFRDINPVAPVHVLIVPNKHIASVSELDDEDGPLVGRLFTAARDLAEQEKIAAPGYRLIINNGADGGQVVYHLHLHLIGGQKMRYPMG